MWTETPGNYGDKSLPVLNLLTPPPRLWVRVNFFRERGIGMRSGAIDTTTTTDDGWVTKKSRLRRSWELVPCRVCISWRLIRHTKAYDLGLEIYSRILTETRRFVAHEVPFWNFYGRAQLVTNSWMHTIGATLRLSLCGQFSLAKTVMVGVLIVYIW